MPKSDPKLYETLRSLDAINQVVSRSTNIIMRTDAARFKVLIAGPPGISSSAAKRASTAKPAPAPAPILPAAAKLGAPTNASASAKSTVQEARRP